MPSEVCAQSVIATDESTRASSSTATRVGERVGAGAAVLLRERDPHPAELAELADDLVRERLRPVELAGDRGDLALGEVADGLAERLVLFGQVEDHAANELSHSSSSTSTAPRATVSPSAAWTARTRAGARRGERHLHLHRLDHDERRRAPRPRRPAATRTRITVPGIGATISSSTSPPAWACAGSSSVRRRRRRAAAGRLSRNGRRQTARERGAGGGESGG